MTSDPSEEFKLLAADDRRRRAMVEGDVATLERLLAKTLVHTHATGRAENKEQYLAPFRAGTRVYETVDRSDAEAIVRGDTGWIHGRQFLVTAHGGQRRESHNRFLSVWVKELEIWRMAAFMTTAIKA